VSALWAGLIGGPAVDSGPEADREQTRPRLRAVPRSAPRLSRRPFATVLIALFGLGMTGLLMLNTTLQNQAFESRTLSRQATELAHVQADLETQLDLASAPQELVKRATLLGMRPNPHAAFLVLPSGKVIGKPTPVKGNEVPNLLYKTEAEIATEVATADAAHASKLAKKAADKRATALRQQSLDIAAQEQKLEAAKQPDTSAGKTGKTAGKKTHKTSSTSGGN
jgi:hypothetical protein